MAHVPEWVDEIIDEEKDTHERGSGVPEPADTGTEPSAGSAEPGTGSDETEALASEETVAQEIEQDTPPAGGEPEPEGEEKRKASLLSEIAKLRQSRRELEARLKEKDDRIARYDTLETRLAELQARFNPPKEQEKPPEFAYDPTANLDHRTKQVESDVAQLRKEREERESALSDRTAREVRIREGLNKVREHEHVFRQAHTDYDAALDHARSRLHNQIKTQNEIWGRFVSDDQIQNHIAELELRTAFQALDNGLDPAEVAYKLARQQYGYNPETTAPENVDEETKRLEDGLKASRGGRSGAGKRTVTQPVDGADNLPELEAALDELTRHFH